MRLQAPQLTSPARTHIAELDGIRGLAIALVLIDHYLVAVTAPRYGLYFHLAWSGVDLFFVLSGYLLAGILLDAKNSPGYYKTFYLRRFHRIVPLYSIWLGIFAVGAYLITRFADDPLTKVFSGLIPIWTYFLFLQNFAMSVKGSYGAIWMGITWSLAVEEQFYLLLPLLIRRLSRRALCVAFFFIIFSAPVLRIAFEMSGADKVVMYTLLPCRADSLGLGVLVALACRNPAIWSWITSHRRYIYSAFSMFGFGVAMWTTREFPIMDRIGFTWMGAFYTCLLLLVLANPGPTERWIFGKSPLVRLGKIAYGVYLFHRGVLWLCHFLIFGRAPVVRDMATLLVTLLALVITLVLAELSWKFLEGPLVRQARSRYRYSDFAGVSGAVPLLNARSPKLPVESASPPTPRTRPVWSIPAPSKAEN